MHIICKPIHVQLECSMILYCYYQYVFTLSPYNITNSATIITELVLNIHIGFPNTYSIIPSIVTIVTINHRTSLTSSIHHQPFSTTFDQVLAIRNCCGRGSYLQILHLFLPPLPLPIVLEYCWPWFNIVKLVWLVVVNHHHPPSLSIPGYQSPLIILIEINHN